MKHTDFRLTGLIAATYSPTTPDGQLNLRGVEAQAAHLVANRVAGAFTAGTTGESLSFTVAERQALTARWAEVARDLPLKVIAHVGHNCLADAQAMAAHAEQVGAHAIAAMAPCYFRPSSVEHLADFLGGIAAAAPRTPFYFYDIPSWTRVNFPTEDLLRIAREKIPTFVGIKFTNSDLAELQHAIRFDGGAFDILFGCDEALLAGLALGCRGAVGSTYNFAAPLYHRVIEAFEKGDLATARAAQEQTVALVAALGRYQFMPAAKGLMGMLGVECGPVRPPLAPLDAAQLAAVRADLEQLGFFDWIREPIGSSQKKSIPSPLGPAVRVAAKT